MTTKIEPNTTRRSAPNQQRSRDTLEQILIAAADLIEEVGFEKLSTNMICRRAELTPPALYRYFPNKYSVLKELGERLMVQQNILMENWSLDAGDLSNLEAEIETLLFETIRVTRQTKAGAWIMRSMHATPVLAGVRVESHRHVARLLAERIIETRPDLDHGHILPSARLSVEIGYAVVEMVFDERSIDEGEILRQTASMLAFSLRQAMSHQA
ncbi:TetR/AcrR family transcriptional regulator [Hyphomonas sp.]|uniref:TetR/AcrR family transcriptional regulator n=1 Tax=Hyphomonas sp. TaxID=87 RepID=UPI000E06EF73|nr:TetR/AcrR family transcriptional regulator [Hyphomonas sp.]RCL89791.1 MAG: TetR/AcrR family transcriptional regulator [Hyphomonas sp.]